MDDRTITFLSTMVLSDTPSDEPSFVPKIRIKHIDAAVKRIGKNLADTNSTDGEGVLYAAKNSDLRFPYTKLGYSAKDDDTRIKALRSCGIMADHSYQTEPFFGAYQAEQILHDIQVDRAQFRENCPCKRRNREWYDHDFYLIVNTIRLVKTWMLHEPYDLKTMKLKGKWQEALKIWNSTQRSTKPLSWLDFFLMGLNLKDSRRPGLIQINSAKPGALRSTTPPPRLSGHPNTATPTRPSKLAHAHSEPARSGLAGSYDKSFSGRSNTMHKLPSRQRYDATPTKSYREKTKQEDEEDDVDDYRRRSDSDTEDDDNSQDNESKNAPKSTHSRRIDDPVGEEDSISNSDTEDFQSGDSDVESGSERDDDNENDNEEEDDEDGEEDEEGEDVKKSYSRLVSSGKEAIDKKGGRISEGKRTSLPERSRGSSPLKVK